MQGAHVSKTANYKYYFSAILGKLMGGRLWGCVYMTAGSNSIRVEICRVFTRSKLESSAKNSTGHFHTSRIILKKLFLKGKFGQKLKFWYFVEFWTLILMVYVPPSCDLPFLRYSQFKSRNGAAATTWPRLWHTSKTPCDVLEMSWTRARSLLVCILHKFFEFSLSKEGQSSRISW